MTGACGCCLLGQEFLELGKEGFGIHGLEGLFIGSLEMVDRGLVVFTKHNCSYYILLVSCTDSINFSKLRNV
jgi:hypothetical protein